MNKQNVIPKREIRKEFEKRLRCLRTEIDKTLERRDPHLTGLFPAIWSVISMCYGRNYRDLTKPYHCEEKQQAMKLTTSEKNIAKT